MAYQDVFDGGGALGQGGEQQNAVREGLGAGQLDVALDHFHGRHSELLELGGGGSDDRGGGAAGDGAGGDAGGAQRGQAGHDMRGCEHPGASGTLGGARNARILGQDRRCGRSQEQLHAREADREG